MNEWTRGKEEDTNEITVLDCEPPRASMLMDTHHYLTLARGQDATHNCSHCCHSLTLPLRHVLKVYQTVIIQIIKKNLGIG